MIFLDEQCEKLNINLNKDQIEKFKIYYNFLVEYNKSVNLTSITEKNEVCIKHFIDSLLITKAINLKGKIIDVGTGAGFPGVPLKIFNPDLDIYLLDSSEKKTKFLEKLSNLLDLKFEIINSRSEDLANNSNYRGKFDVCVSRAVASIDILSEICTPFLKIGGILAAFKGPSLYDELEYSNEVFSNLKSKVVNIEKFDLPCNYGTRYLAFIKKIKDTPKMYPRVYSKIKNESDLRKTKFLKRDTCN